MEKTMGNEMVCRKRVIADMYVLSMQDIQRIEKCSYSRAKRIFETMNRFHINGKPYVLANEYFCKDFNINEVVLCQPLGEGLDTKVVKLLPPILSSGDIAAIFDCSHKRGEEIMAVIPNTFKVNNSSFVKIDDFRVWINSLPNTEIIVGDYRPRGKKKEGAKQEE